MRIGFVHSNEFPSLEADLVQVVQVCRAFHACGQEVTLFVPRSKANSSDAAARADAARLYGSELPYEVRFIPATEIFGKLKVLGTVKGTLEAIRQTPLDLIYTRNPWTVAFLPKAGVPYVFEAHEERVHLGSKFLNSFLRSTIVKNSRKPSCVMMVAISKALCDIWESFGVPRAKLLDAHDGVDLSLFNLSLSKEAARQQLRLSNKRKIVVYTGMMTANRGIEMILAAASVLPELEFQLVGGKDGEIEHWKTEVENLSLHNVHFPGRVPHRDIPAWLAAADILLMMWTWQVPTIRGCSPMKMFEYMAAERLIVGPGFPTVEEVMEHETDGLLFEPDNIGAMIATLRKAAQLTNSPMPRAAREKVAQHYTWQARCQRILDGLAERGMK